MIASSFAAAAAVGWMEADVFAAVNKLGSVFEAVALDDAPQELGDIALEMVGIVLGFVPRNGEMTGMKSHSSSGLPGSTMQRRSLARLVFDLTYTIDENPEEGFEKLASGLDKLGCRGHESKGSRFVAQLSTDSLGSSVAFVACNLEAAE